MARPRTIHDFYGFPPELYDVGYPAPGLPALVDEVAEIVQPTWVGADQDSWGIDHGTWSVLLHAFPDADIPVVQLSINAEQPLEYHHDLGARLAPLRERGVLVLGSGNIVHNLRVMSADLRDSGSDWAARFDDAAHELLTSAPADVLKLREHPDFDRAVPTADHFIPMLYFAGLAEPPRHRAGAGLHLWLVVDDVLHALITGGTDRWCVRRRQQRLRIARPEHVHHDAVGETIGLPGDQADELPSQP